ncbi:hypothetical protein [Mesorhizobium carmichaelinearum]|uniref:hypothetical protein n=1 Tax=Mesorhizobium carmichaelinearum TaxID=1208188 RepID=UPI0015CAF85C|nr:hypothetical protein [Mesorhizobium carmichaelinearum]
MASIRAEWMVAASLWWAWASAEFSIKNFMENHSLADFLLVAVFVTLLQGGLEAVFDKTLNLIFFSAFAPANIQVRNRAAPIIYGRPSVSA